jgi:hypothetical protein
LLLFITFWHLLSLKDEPSALNTCFFQYETDESVESPSSSDIDIIDMAAVQLHQQAANSIGDGGAASETDEFEERDEFMEEGRNLKILHMVCCVLQSCLTCQPTTWSCSGLHVLLGVFRGTACPL